ncbi:hypothetical protein B0H17DRAFT_1146571 [Mycena rosella]|uniref:Uncharacterized protein n=1 Tax=Mycena rosella TaxID=1033263 RepID=A0AAD7CR47_MYCRO|nr:hypothetical protein B0H17DRAFT_1146571 [Mycena rosella]
MQLRIVLRQTSLNAATIFTVVGVLKSFDLLLVKRNSLTAVRVPYARAYIKVVGYDSTHFATAMANVKDLAYDLSTNFPADCIQIYSDLDWVAAAATTLWEATYRTTNITFQNYIDPAESISWRTGSALCRERCCISLLKKNKYAAKAPSGFRVSDIVEMGFELVVFGQTKRGGDDKHICKVVLRTLTFLDGSLAKVAFNTRADTEQASKSVTASQKKPKQVPAKRQLEFADLSSDDEDDPDTRKHMAGLKLNDTSEQTTQGTDDAEMETGQNSV